ncbi:MAG: parvulin-like peptidyl-prolyl isomerase [Kiritimatiellia bacterium]|jgi:parvulin-like peptidyl-prolyl isomerase
MNKSILIPLVFLTFVTTFSSAHAQNASAASDPGTNAVMRVNGLSITRNMIDSERAMIQQALPTATEVFVMKSAVSNLTQRLALNHAVVEANITVTNAEVEQQVRETKGLLPDNLSLNGFLSQRGMDKGQLIQQLAASLQINKYFQKRIKPYEPSAKEIGDYYTGNKDAFFVPAAVDVQHFMISVNDNTPGEAIAKKRQQLTRYLEQIQQGESFDDLATLFSEGPKASEGGRLGYLGRESFSDELRGEVFKMKEIGSFTEILTSKEGLHIFKLLGRREAVPLRLDQCQEQIKTFLKRRYQQAERERVLKELVTAAKVERL